VFGSTFAAGTALAHGLYNISFAGSTSMASSPFYVQVSLTVIRNSTLKLNFQHFLWNAFFQAHLC